MNIEEERKAFLIHNPPAQCLNFVDGKWQVRNTSIYQENVLIITCIRWESWLAAKEHAAEMAKPAVRVIEGTGKVYPWIVRHADGQYGGYNIESFKTKEDGEVWATKCGYRVIE